MSVDVEMRKHTWLGKGVWQCRLSQAAGQSRSVNNIRLRKASKRGRSWDGVSISSLSLTGLSGPHCQRCRRSGGAPVLVRSVLPPGWRWPLLREDPSGASRVFCGTGVPPLRWPCRNAALGYFWSWTCPGLRKNALISDLGFSVIALICFVCIFEIPKQSLLVASGEQICFSCMNQSALTINLAISSWYQRNFKITNQNFVERLNHPPCFPSPDNPLNYLHKNICSV